MREISKDNLLRSWKEIAAYLGCDVRTCHRWEDQRGMPVHRAEGSEKKSPVFAYKDELDTWFKGTFRASDTTKMKAVPAPPARPWLKWALAVTAVVVLAGAFFREGGLLVKRQPADFAIEGSFLVALDKHEQELWRWDSGLEDLKNESFYREHFQVRDHNSGNILPAIIIKDIDGDGDTEVLFAPKRVTDQTGEGRLRCFDRKGAEIWNFPAGKELRCGGKVYSPDYRIAGFHAHDFEGDGKFEIVVEAFHAPDWPCQLALLDHLGKLVGEYWNAGYLRDVAYQDINGDGREELIVVGVNNEYRAGCLMVFDPRRIGGGSPQSGAYACEGLAPGTELFYAVMPRTDVSEALGLYEADLRTLDITENRRIRATSSIGLIFEFDFDLKPLQVTPGHGYVTAHERLTREGKVTSVLGAAYERMVLDGIRYWNGTALAAEPLPTTAGASGR
jgi:hypothetical protein